MHVPIPYSTYNIEKEKKICQESMNLTNLTFFYLGNIKLISIYISENRIFLDKNGENKNTKA